MPWLLYSWRNNRQSHWICGWPGPRGGLHILEGNKISFPCSESKLRTSSSKPKQNTHYAIQATYNIITDSINILYPIYTLLPLQLTVDRRNILSAAWHIEYQLKQTNLMFTINHFTSLINHISFPCCCIWNAVLNFCEALHCWLGCEQVKFTLHQWIKINIPFHFRTNHTNVTGRTLLHFYFRKGTSLRIRRDILNSWHQLVGE